MKYVLVKLLTPRPDVRMTMTDVEWAVMAPIRLTWPKCTNAAG